VTDSARFRGLPETKPVKWVGIRRVQRQFGVDARPQVVLPGVVTVAERGTLAIIFTARLSTILTRPHFFP
jgi:hypothetical protein